MRITGIPGLLAAAVLSASALLATPAGPASAEACPDVKVIYARGTSEPVGVGQVGQAFVDALCPSTRIVLSGFSQGAVVAGFVTSATVPEGVPTDLVPAPLQPEVADHVAAVTLFGMPSATWMQSIGAPPVVIGPLYAAKTINLCSPGDEICDGTPGGMPGIAHLMYGANGMVGQAAAFAANRL